MDEELTTFTVSLGVQAKRKIVGERLRPTLAGDLGSSTTAPDSSRKSPVASPCTQGHERQEVFDLGIAPKI